VQVDHGLLAQLDLAPSDRRESDRVAAPLDAWRLGTLETPVRLYDLSLGGCFVTSLHEQAPGVVVRLRIQLPDGQWIDTKAETLYCRPGFGFAVRFRDLSRTAMDGLDRALEQMRSAAAS
jgi:hypothetical protein